MIGTAANLDSKDNIGVMSFVEQENIKLAKGKGFRGIFTTNTNPLAQQICEDVLGYEKMSEVVANQYVTQSGKKPFDKASNKHKAFVMYKSLGK